MLLSDKWIITPAGHITQVKNGPSFGRIWKFDMHQFQQFLTTYNTDLVQYFVKGGYIYGICGDLDTFIHVDFGTPEFIHLDTIKSLSLKDLFNNYKEVNPIGEIRKFLDSFSSYDQLEEYLYNYETQELIITEVSNEIPTENTFRIQRNKDWSFSVLPFEPVREFVNTFGAIVKDPYKMVDHLQDSLALSGFVTGNARYDAIRLAAYEKE